MAIQDYDLSACLEFNPQDGFVFENVVEIRAVWEGENDGDNWRWVLVLENHRDIFLKGGCDYTGWDCQSWASHEVVTGPEDLDRILDAESPNVALSLRAQLAAGKKETWREKMYQEFGF